MKVCKNAIERYQRLSLEEKEKSGNMFVSNTEIYQKIKKQQLVQYRKKYYKMRKNALL